MATPLAAQAQTGAATEEVSQQRLEEISSMMSNLFVADPLTAEQEARLPAAQAVVGAMMPDGFYGTMMTDIVDKMMRPMMTMFSSPEIILSARLDLDEEAIGQLTEAEQAEISAMLDPAFDQRVDAIIGVMTEKMGGMFAVMEDPMREGLSKAYAVRFDDNQLADIAAFFATPTGSVYAKESMALFSDPQVMQASMKALPAMMSSFGNIETAMEESMANLPKEAAYSDLTAAQRQRLAELLGIEPEDLSEVIKPPRPMAPDEPGMVD
ncbi:MAG: hypothetical protein CL575_07970 [Altererythrobacter sp.]|nr:hypothetical protein [Altererythrobacter sp.]